MNFPNPTTLVGVMLVLALLPFAAIVVSSYIKIVVVIFLVRNALGVQMIPPNLAVNGLAIILSVYIMAPIANSMYERLSTPGLNLTDIASPETQAALSESLLPIKGFLIKHSSLAEREFFASTTKKIWPEEDAEKVDDEHFLVLLPSFTTSQLTSAFQIGFLIFLPFVVIDLIVSNILLAMGMMMVSPMTISLPFKLLLFVVADGWTKLIHGLVLTYQ